MNQKIYAALRRLWPLTFLLMGISALLFSLVSLNLIVLFRANFDLVTRHGAMALFDGALYQQAELAVMGYLALIFYLVFKLCEKALVERACS